MNRELFDRQFEKNLNFGEDAKSDRLFRGDRFDFISDHEADERVIFATFLPKQELSEPEKQGSIEG
ncbi:MAG: hypothetical protein WA882_18210, partial [Geitlerinemataceae cyanobacterium]